MKSKVEFHCLSPYRGGNIYRLRFGHIAAREQAAVRLAERGWIVMRVETP